MYRSSVVALLAVAACCAAAADTPAVPRPSPVAEWYGGAGEYRSAALSQDGSRVAAVRSTDDGGSEVILEDFSGAGPRRILAHAASATRLRYCRWKTQALLLCAATQGQDGSRQSLLAVQVDGAGERDLGEFDTILSLLPNDPTRVYVKRVMMINRSPFNRFGRLDLRNGKFFEDSNRQCGLRLWLTDSLGVARVCDGTNGYGVRPMPDGPWQLVHATRRPLPDWYSPAAFDELTNELLLTDVLDGRLALFASIGNGPRRTVFADPSANAAEVTMIGKQPRPAAVAVMDGQARWEPIDPRVSAVRSAVQRALQANVVLVHEEDWNQRYYLVWAGSELVSNAGSFYRFDSRDERLDRLGKPRAQVSRSPPAPRTALELKTSDGVPGIAHVTLPAAPAATPLPLVVVPGAMSSRTDFVVPFLTASGYAVVDYPLERLNPDAWPGAGWRATAAEIEASIAELAKSGTIDRKRVCAVGRDLGAYSALMAASERPGLFRCIVGIETTVEPFKGAMSAIEAARHIGIPVLLFHSGADKAAVKLRDAIADKGPEPELVTYDDMSFEESMYRINLLARLDAYIEKHLRH